MAGVFRLLAPQYTGYIAATVGTSAQRPFTGLTGAQIGFITVEGGPLRLSLARGATAHSATGHIVSAGLAYEILGADVFNSISVISPDVTGTLLLSVGYQ